MVQPKFKIKSMPSDLVYFSTSIWVLTKVIPLPGVQVGKVEHSLFLSRYRADSESTVSNCSLREQRDIKIPVAWKFYATSRYPKLEGGWGGAGVADWGCTAKLNIIITKYLAS